MAEEIDFPDQVKLFKYFTNHGYKILCETSKIFEKLILKRIMEIQKDISTLQVNNIMDLKNNSAAGIWNLDMSGFQMVNLCPVFEWPRFWMVY